MSKLVGVVDPLIAHVQGQEHQHKLLDPTLQQHTADLEDIQKTLGTLVTVIDAGFGKLDLTLRTIHKENLTRATGPFSLRLPATCD